MILGMNIATNTFGLQEDLTPNLLFIDGLTRCGKSIFSPLIGTFEETEQLRFFNLLEQLIPAITLGSIEIGFARSLIRTQLNEFIYDIKLSRNANFRRGDQTSIYSHPEFESYELRLKKNDGDAVVTEIQNSRHILPIMLHDAMASIDAYIDLGLKFKMIEIYRHPVDLIISQYKQGWGRRFGNDPRAFTLTISKNNLLYPWYALKNEERWDSYSELERTVWMTITLLERSILNHKKLSSSDNVLTLRYEDLVTNPSPVISRVSDFISKRHTQHTWKTLTDSNIPRNIDIDRRSANLRLLDQGIRDELRNSLSQLVDSFELNCYGVPHLI